LCGAALLDCQQRRKKRRARSLSDHTSSASVLIPCRADLADRLKKGSTNPALSACRGHAVVVKVDHRVRVAQRCLRPPDDLRVDIACWLGPSRARSTMFSGFASNARTCDGGKLSGPGSLNKDGSAAACTPCTSRLSAETASASASVAGAITISMAKSSGAKSSGAKSSGAKSSGAKSSGGEPPPI
jgi:hypothetical protein